MNGVRACVVCVLCIALCDVTTSFGLSVVVAVVLAFEWCSVFYCLCFVHCDV